MNFQEAEAALAKAAVKASQQDFDAAYDLYVRAAKAFLHLALTNASRPQPSTLSARCRENAKKALDRAEQIKARRTSASASAQGPAGTAPPHALRPSAVNMYSEEDQLAVLDRSTRINGKKFPLWEQRHAFADPTLTDIFQDPDESLSLSHAQAELFGSWWRPCESEGEGTIMTTADLRADEIYQHIVTNCSVIAGLVVCWEHNIRFGGKLCLSSIYPQQGDGTPQFQPYGRYSVQLLLNGTYRQIVIDDALPATPEGVLLCASTHGTRVLWPSIIEKAYMKVMGGYDFPGSNPAVDLHAILGWIPEEIDFHGSDFQMEKTWSRVHDGFISGRCLLTLGTGEQLRNSAVGPNLVPLHGYSVIDMKETAASCKVKIMNPWITSTRGSAERPQSRASWMEWNEICKVFDSLYLNWDPSLFKHTRTFHGFWRREGNRKRSSHRLRFSTQALKSLVNDEIIPEMWFLLTRHVVSKDHPSEYISLDAVSRGKENDLHGDDFLSQKSAYSNSTHVLQRVHLDSSTRISVMVSRDMEDLAEEDRNRPVAFTLTVFSPISINLLDHPPRRPYTVQVEGSFTSRTSGGNPTHRTFMHNPQYKLRLQSAQGSKPLGIRIVFEASRKVAIKAVVVWGGGKRVTKLTQGDVQLDTGPYVYGTTAVGGVLKPSDSTLILSTFTPGQQSPFSISIEADGPVSLESIPAEGAGMFTKSIKGRWKGTSAAGNPDFRRFHLNPHFNIEISKPTSLFCRLQLIEAPSGTAINLTIFRKDDAGQIKDQVMTSGSYAEAICGVATNPVQLHGPGSYSVIVSTFEQGVEASFELTAYSSACPLSIHPS